MGGVNLFELISNDPARVNIITLKSKLAVVLVELIRERGWTQKEAAAFMQVSQPRISNLFKSKLDLFSIDTLIELIVKMGYKLDLTFTPENSQRPLEMALIKAVV